MGDPREALPKVSLGTIEKLLDNINLPTAKHIEILQTGAQYHVIAILRIENSDELILRIAGQHVPKVKTENEVTVITWLQQNTTIPVPVVVHFDSSTNNVLGCEYIIQKRLPGQSLDILWPTLDEEERLHILDFAADCLRQLNARPFHHIGSLRRAASAEYQASFLPGPVLDERFWEARDIERHFPTGSTYESLNPIGPYSSYVAYSIARLEKYSACILLHPSLEFMRRHIPLIMAFMSGLRAAEQELNRGTKLRLAHRDLHMGNIMYDPLEKRITGILDWEFSIVMPLQQGDLSRAFLHDLQPGPGWPQRKKERLKILRQRGFGDVLDEYAYASERQEEMQTAVDLLRAIVEVSPRGQRGVEKMEWMKEALGIMRRWVEPS